VYPISRPRNLETQYEFRPSWVLEVGYVGSRGVHQSNGQSNGSGGNAGTNNQPINVANLASPTNPLYCGYDGNPADCVTMNSPSNTALLPDSAIADRVPLLGFASGSASNSTTGDYKFNSLQITVRKQLSHGLQFQAAYTFSRSFVNYWVGNPAAIALGIL
jgi:hypothetical protein